MDAEEIKTGLRKILRDVDDAKDKLARGEDFGLHDTGPELLSLMRAATSLADSGDPEMGYLMQQARVELKTFIDEVSEGYEIVRAEREAQAEQAGSDGAVDEDGDMPGDVGTKPAATD